MNKRTIKEMADELYQDEELSAAVVADANRRATTKKIEKGELVLPHPIDAKRWLDQQKLAQRKLDEEDE